MIRVFLLFASIALFVPACSIPQRVPHQDIPGVDVPHPEDANPHDVTDRGTTPSADTPLLGNFVEQLTVKLRENPGAVAVFPALTPSAIEGVNVVNGLGEHLAEKTTNGLEDAGVRVHASSNLISLLRGAEQRVSAYGNVSDAWVLADLVGADYFVTGKVVRRVFDIQKRDESLDLDWLCRKVKGGEIVARYRIALPGGVLANELMRYYRLESEWERIARREGLVPTENPQ